MNIRGWGSEVKVTCILRDCVRFDVTMNVNGWSLRFMLRTFNVIVTYIQCDCESVGLWGKSVGFSGMGWLKKS